MARLVLIRHAKSSWPDHVPDVERPLAQRGISDCSEAAIELTARGITLDAVAISSAHRTQETWMHLSQGLEYSPETSIHPSLYEASVGSIISVVNTFNTDTLAVIGHAPGMPRTAFAFHDGSTNTHLSRLSLKYPTLGIAVLESALPLSQWEPGCAVLTDFFVPRADPQSLDND